MTKDRWWCSDGCGFVEESHRCEQWNTVHKIPGKAIDEILAEFDPDPKPSQEEIDNWAPRALVRLQALENDGVDVASYAAANRLLKELAEHDIKPDRIVRTAEDLIAFWFKGGEKAHVEACSDGEYVISIYLSSLEGECEHHELATAVDVVTTLLDRVTMGITRPVI